MDEPLRAKVITSGNLEGGSVTEGCEDYTQVGAASFPFRPGDFASLPCEITEEGAACRWPSLA
jgi:hypothetical protein